MSIPDSAIAVTLFNLRAHCTTESDLDRTLGRLAAMGYQAIQVSGVKLPAATIRQLLDRHKLHCVATHEDMAAIAGDPEPLVERLKILNCNFTAPGSPGKDFAYTDLAAVRQLAETFNRAGRVLKSHGIELGYHNHHRELMRIADTGKTMLEVFCELTDPDRVKIELDVHWVTRGGGSPASWIRKLKGRIPVIHFKDFALVDSEPVFAEIGEGNLDWPEILKACRETGVRWYSIEQDKEFPGRDIFTSTKLSIDNLRMMGVK